MKTNGLSGVVVGTTRICNCNEEEGLSYYGYRIQDLAENCEYEEVAYLLEYGNLPNLEQLKNYQNEIIHYRELPKSLVDMIKTLPKNSNIMTLLEVSIAYLGVLEPEKEEVSNSHNIKLRIMSAICSVLVYWFYYTEKNCEVDFYSNQVSLAGYFLEKLGILSEENKQAFNMSLILYAEHDFNASTFASRICASTKSDLYSCIVCAIGTLKGSLHGGANEESIHFIRSFSSVSGVSQKINQMLDEKKLIMGFGHRIYGKKGDPRTTIIKAKTEEITKRSEIFLIAEAIETVMREKRPGLPPNLDFYSAVLYDFLGIKSSYFTPIFVMSRVAGWFAHIEEQREVQKLIRPTSVYVGKKNLVFKKLEER